MTDDHQCLSLVATINEVVNAHPNPRASDNAFPPMIHFRRVWCRLIDGVWVALYRFDFRGRRFEYMANLRDLSPLMNTTDQNPPPHPF